MTFIDDDQVEKVRGELLIDVLLFLSAGDGLIQAEIDLKRFIHRAVGDFRHRLTERLKVVGLGLVGQNVAIDEKEDAFFYPGLPEPPNDLKCRVGLAGAGGHHEQDTILAAGDGIDRAIDGDRLVVTGCFSGAVVVIVLCRYHLLFGCEAFRPPISRPEFLRRWELVERDFAGDGGAGDSAIMFQKSVAVGAVREGDVQNFRVFEGLLHAIAHGVVVVFGFQDCQWKIRFVGEDVVGFLRFTACDCLASNDDPAFGEVEFLPDLGHQVPFVAVQADKRRSNVLGADVRFGELFFVHGARART